jgi:hypothetical protein
MPAFNVPFVVLHGLADRVTQPALSRTLHATARSTDKVCVWGGGVGRLAVKAMTSLNPTCQVLSLPHTHLGVLPRTCVVELALFERPNESSFTIYRHSRCLPPCCADAACFAVLSSLLLPPPHLTHTTTTHDLAPRLPRSLHLCRPWSCTTARGTPCCGTLPPRGPSSCRTCWRGCSVEWWPTPPEPAPSPATRSLSGRRRS